MNSRDYLCNRGNSLRSIKADLSGKKSGGPPLPPGSPPFPPSLAREAGCLSSSPAEGSKLRGYSAETDLNLHRCALRTSPTYTIL